LENLVGSETVRGIAAEMRANAFGKKTLVDGRIHALTYYEGPCTGNIGNQWLFSECVLSSPFHLSIECCQVSSVFLSITFTHELGRGREETWGSTP
jgi:hypothetical protein